MFGVEGVAEEQLPGEHPERALRHLHLDLLRLGRGLPLGLHGQHVALHVELDRVGVHARQVERDDEAVSVAPGVHRHGASAGTTCPVVAEDLLGQAVQLTERVGAHQHR